MKVFIPMSDVVLDDDRCELTGKLVPFNPEFLAPREGQNSLSNKPRNWIADDDYISACKRLLASSELAPA
ncbi:MAG: hypothetical protein O2780_01320 [Proteobacteria bacterium]|nr:hypothetical protein [Pseudomonadota bacterium]MDA1302383.1 hypothetical protein [Pseudomonadota bacterium]